MKNDDQMKFFKENFQVITKLNQEYNKYQKTLNGKVSMLESELDLTEYNEKVKSWVASKSILVLDFHFIEGIIAIDAKISPAGWRVVIWDRSKKNPVLLSEVRTRLSNNKQLGLNLQDGVFELDIEIRRDEMKQNLGLIIKEVVKFMDERK